MLSSHFAYSKRDFFCHRARINFGYVSSVKFKSFFIESSKINTKRLQLLKIWLGIRFNLYCFCNNLPLLQVFFCLLHLTILVAYFFVLLLDMCNRTILLPLLWDYATLDKWRWQFVPLLLYIHHEMKQ